jgi:hypothetical protein
MNTYTSGYYDYETRTYVDCDREWVSKLMLTNVTETSLTLYGEVDHSEFYDSEDYWWNSYNIRRSVFMGDFVYAISANGITATNLSTMENSASIPLDFQNPYEDYYDVHSEEVDESEDTTEEESSSEGSAPKTD